MKQSEIKMAVTLDDENVPVGLEWEAAGSGMEGKKACNAMLMTIWDGKERTTLRIDLWTKDMLVDDMKRFFYESFVTMADTYKRATSDPKTSDEIRRFAESFGKMSGLFEPGPSS